MLYSSTLTSMCVCMPPTNGEINANGRLFVAFFFARAKDILAIIDLHELHCID